MDNNSEPWPTEEMCRLMFADVTKVETVPDMSEAKPLIPWLQKARMQILLACAKKRR